MPKTKSKKKGARKNKRSKIKIIPKKVDQSRPKEEQKKELKVSAIVHGTVIDHIPADQTYRVADILDLSHHEGVVSIATGLISKSMGKKGIVKVSGKELTKEEVNKIAIIAPDATVNLIKNFIVKEKIKVKSPDVVENVIKCSNPLCITNTEIVRTKFYVVKKDPLKITCHYCERSMGKENLEII
jgi:aspartate carbamoyltransferase regulatory subunit